MRVFQIVSAVFQSVDDSVAAANAADKAYNDSTGNPEGYTAFGADKAETVAINLAGLYAADSAANILAMMLDGVVNERTYVSALEAIADISLNATEKYIVAQVANVAQRAGQPFRGITSSPLARITRSVNMSFNLLPDDKREKDFVQLRAGAQFLLDKINS
ncbi:MAG: hypothetical protein NUV56_04840 [Candidatus Uhrbacteria bacterium]|nr:hypothetical protein [Candidatus Uhrbacteria bacterium]